MIWHRVCSFEQRLQIASHLCQCAFDRNSTSPAPPHQRALLQPAARGPRADQAFDHLLCVSFRNARGSSTKTDDEVNIAVQAACKHAGLTTFTEPNGEMRYQAPPTRVAPLPAYDRTSDRRPARRRRHHHSGHLHRSHHEPGSQPHKSTATPPGQHGSQRRPHHDTRD